ncbi:MAG: right-handed parallel beta-helix repeat-containing protein, partial [Myxococcales bacterium]
TTSSLAFTGTLATARVESNTGYGFSNAGALTVTQATIASNRRAGVYSTGNAQLTRNEIRFNGDGDPSFGYGVYFVNGLPSGNQSMSANLVHRNWVGGLYLTSTTAVNDLIEHNTFDNNNRYNSTNYGIYANVTAGTVNIRDNIVTNNGEYGLVRAGSSSGFTASYNNIWNHSIGDVSGTGTSNMTGHVSCNPLYVATDGSNYRLTSNSPSRLADSFGGDQGALFHVADDTPTLQGVLRSSRTLTKAGSPWTMPGDLIIAPGVTLTLEAGAELRAAANADAMLCGSRTNRAELLVRGSLVVQGTQSDRARMRPTGSSSARDQWEGVRFEAPSANNDIDFLDIEFGGTCVDVLTSGITLSNTRIHDCQQYGVRVAASPASFNMTGQTGRYGGNFRLESAIWNVSNGSFGYGIHSSGGELNISNTDVYNTYNDTLYFVGGTRVTATGNRFHNSTNGWGVYGTHSTSVNNLFQNNLIYANGYGGLWLQVSGSPGSSTTTIDHNTIDGNSLVNTTNYGMYLSSVAGTTGTVVIRNNIFSNNGEYGLYYQGTTTYRPSPSYNDMWNHGLAHYAGSSTTPVAGTGSLTLDPLYNFPEATVTSDKDFRLQPPSNVRGKDNGTPAGDMGALQFYAIPVDNVRITPDKGSVRAATTQDYVAQAYEGWSNFPIRGIPYSWAVVNGGGTINSAGRFSAVCQLGTYTNSIQAIAGGVPGATDVTIIPGVAASVVVSPLTATIDINQSQTFAASARDSCGNTTSGTVTWAITNPRAGVIDANGVFTANVYSGTYTDVVRETINGIHGYASVEVRPDPVAFILVSPDPATVNVNTTAQFTATGRDNWGNTVPVTPTWSLDPSCTVGSINASTGVFTAG